MAFVKRSIALKTEPLDKSRAVSTYARAAHSLLPGDERAPVQASLQAEGEEEEEDDEDEEEALGG